MSGGAENRTRVRQTSVLTFVHVRDRLTKPKQRPRVGAVLLVSKDLALAEPFCKVLTRWLGNTGRASLSRVDGARIQRRLPSYQLRPLGPGRLRCRSQLYDSIGHSGSSAAHTQMRSSFRRRNLFTPEFLVLRISSVADTGSRTLPSVGYEPTMEPRHPSASCSCPRREKS